MLKFGLVTLGCDKNTVDSERYLADLVAHGGEPVADLAEAEVVVVNTCGFIDAAKQESLEAILGAARLKDAGACKAVFAIGCMVERHKGELLEALPEVDVFLGTSETDRLVPELVERGLLGGALVEHPGVRLFGGDTPHVRYLKVSEGCDHGCAFCAIPLMRGRHRSFALPELVREAQLLEAQGCRELNLVAQDLAHYGRDRRDGAGLPELLEALLRETSIPWIRNLYLYSAGITPRLLEVMAASPRLVPYLDTPMQHGSDAVLARMLDTGLVQAALTIHAYPLGNQDLYAITTLTARNAAGSPLLVRQVLGAKVSKRVWLEAYTTIGSFRNYAEADALYIFNAIDTDRLKAGATAYLQLPRSILLHLGYTFEDRQLYGRTTTFYQHSFTGGITWRH